MERGGTLFLEPDCPATHPHSTLHNGLISPVVLTELYRFALLLTGRGDSADRVLDAVVSDCERRIAQIRDESHRAAWLVARLRQSCMEPRPESPWAAEEAPSPTGGSEPALFDQGLQPEALILVRRFHALPEPERSALALFYLDLLGPEQIAQVLGLALEELSAVLARGRRQIESSLNPDFFQS